MAPADMQWLCYSGDRIVAHEPFVFLLLLYFILCFLFVCFLVLFFCYCFFLFVCFGLFVLCPPPSARCRGHKGVRGHVRTFVYMYVLPYVCVLVSACMTQVKAFVLGRN